MDVEISPETTTRPVLTSVSHATRPPGSTRRTASRTPSEIWSATLSGCPSVTDSEVNRYSLSGSRVMPERLRFSSGACRADLEEVRDHHVLVAELQVIRVREVFDALDLTLALLEELVEVEEGEVDDAGGVARAGEQLGRARLAEDRELHHVGRAGRGQEPRQERDEVVEEVAAPEVEGAVGVRLVVGVDRHLVEARDHEVVAVPRHPRVEVDGLARHAVGDPVAEGVRQRVRDRAAVDVDRVDVLGAVARELDREQPRPAPDVEAAQVLAEPALEQVLPHDEAALGRDEDARLTHDLGELEREQPAASRVEPGLRRGPGRAVRREATARRGVRGRRSERAVAPAERLVADALAR